MGDRLTEDKTPRKTSQTPYGDIFDEAFPHYLAMGMTAEEYWDGESWLKKAYLKAYRIRMEREERIADRNAWLQGRYIREALHSVPQFVAGFMKGLHLGDYPEKPYLEQAEEKKKLETQKKTQEDRAQLSMAMFQAQIAKFNKRFLAEQKKKKEEQSGQ